MSDITVNNFKAFYEQIRPYLGAVHSGFTPIGTVISVMGTTAPLNYLACDGTIYNIADYTELAAYFNQQFGSSNFFGGDGTTTFAVPDLRGEFLRGTGTNSHANQGSGAAVGVHQDGTVHVRVDGGDDSAIYATQAGTSYNNTWDSTIEKNIYSKSANGAQGTGEVWDVFTSRPTNTSVLYCIASKNIFMDAGSNYSTEEQVVGTWIDGRPIYQKTVDCGALPNATEKLVLHNSSNIDVIINTFGFAINSNGLSLPLPYADISNAVICLASNKTNIIINTKDNMTAYFAYITIQYTKTTD